MLATKHFLLFFQAEYLKEIFAATGIETILLYNPGF